MRNIKYLVAVSLDGQIARADGSFECFAQVGDAHHADYLNSLRSFDAVLMGRRTYEVGLKQGVTDPYPFLETYVFSSSMGESPNQRVRMVTGPAAEFVRGLKNGPGGDIYLCGGGRLAAALLEAGLVDEVIVKLNPLLIGSGIPLFAHVAEPLKLELTGSKLYSNGVMLLTYGVLDNRSQPRLQNSIDPAPEGA